MKRSYFFTFLCNFQNSAYICPIFQSKKSLKMYPFLNILKSHRDAARCVSTEFGIIFAERERERERERRRATSLKNADTSSVAFWRAHTLTNCFIAAVWFPYHAVAFLYPVLLFKTHKIKVLIT